MEISAAILAGGRATRMDGADKASLVVGGRRIVERQIAALADVAEDIRIVVGSAGDLARYQDLGIPVVADLVPGIGPLGGLYTALAAARYDRLLVLACDMPFVPAAVLQRLIIESEADGAEMDAVVPRTRRGLEPLCALYRRQVAGTARILIDAGERRMTALLARLQLRALEEDAFAPYDGGTLFTNVNTPHDYARAKGRVEPDEKPSEDRITE